MKAVIRVVQKNKEVMKEISEFSLQTELQKLTELDINEIVYQSLTKEQVSNLAQKIMFLPFEYRSLLFFRYCFETTPFEAGKILEIENAESKVLYVQGLLSRLMELNTAWIDNNSIKEACELALKEDMSYYDNMEMLYKPKYSNSFRRKLKDIKAAQSLYETIKLIAKRAAVFIVVCVLSFSAVLAINAEARERFYHWVVETFPEFSIFITQNKNENSSSAELGVFRIKYVPKEFELIDTTELRTMVIYNYSSNDSQKLTIKLITPDHEDKSYYDTENIEVEEFIFKESQAYTWQTDQMTYLIWYQDGIECHVSGNLDKDEVIKVAENIEK